MCSLMWPWLVRYSILSRMQTQNASNLMWAELMSDVCMRDDCCGLAADLWVAQHHLSDEEYYFHGIHQALGRGYCEK